MRRNPQVAEAIQQAYFACAHRSTDTNGVLNKSILVERMAEVLDTHYGHIEDEVNLDCRKESCQREIERQLRNSRNRFNVVASQEDFDPETDLQQIRTEFVNIPSYQRGQADKLVLECTYAEIVEVAAAYSERSKKLGARAARYERIVSRMQACGLTGLRDKVRHLYGL